MTVDLSQEVIVITAVHKTPNLLRKLANGLLSYYPTVTWFLVDNNSQNETTGLVWQLGTERANVCQVMNKANVGHGPAIHQCLKLVQPLPHIRYAFTLDSDCEIKKGGFLEAMMFKFSDQNIYAVGEVCWLDPVGEPAHRTGVWDVRAVQLYGMMFDVGKYWALPQFNHHGAPQLLNMRGARDKGYKLVDFPIKDYVHHLYGKTRHKIGGIPMWSERRPEDAKSSDEMLSWLSEVEKVEKAKGR